MTDDMNEPWMTCKELVELVTAYLDEVMEPDTRALFEAHLEKCRGCRNYLDQFRTTVQTVAGIDQADLDPGFRERLFTAFRDWR